jgi:hypothetical protein
MTQTHRRRPVPMPPAHREVDQPDARKALACVVCFGAALVLWLLLLTGVIP